jgi:hypothetical protein
MTTAGLDFFDQDFFQDQVVVLCKFPISKMKWYSSVNDQVINDWKLENAVTFVFLLSSQFNYLGFILTTEMWRRDRDH